MICDVDQEGYKTMFFYFFTLYICLQQCFSNESFSFCQTTRFYVSQMTVNYNLPAFFWSLYCPLKCHKFILLLYYLLTLHTYFLSIYFLKYLCCFLKLFLSDILTTYLSTYHLICFFTEQSGEKESSSLKCQKPTLHKISSKAYNFI